MHMGGHPKQLVWKHLWYLHHVKKQNSFFFSSVSKHTKSIKKCMLSVHYLNSYSTQKIICVGTCEATVPWHNLVPNRISTSQAPASGRQTQDFVPRSTSEHTTGQMQRHSAAPCSTSNPSKWITNLVNRKEKRRATNLCSLLNKNKTNCCKFYKIEYMYGR